MKREEEYREIQRQASESYRNIPNWMKAIERKLSRRRLKEYDIVEILSGPFHGYYGTIVCIEGANQFLVEIVEPSGWTLVLRSYTSEQLRLSK